MTTQILPPTQANIVHAAGLLQQSQVVAFPTETVYGLGAVVWDEVAVKKIYQVKGRPADNPLIAHVANWQMARELQGEMLPEVQDIFDVLGRAFWPGPISLVVPKSSRVPAAAAAGLPTIAIRWPAHRVAQDLITSVGAPVVAPSANISGRPSPTTAQHVFDDLAGKIQVILDGDSCQVGIESTVVALAPDHLKLLRPGQITAAELTSQTGLEVIDATQPSTKPLSPGQKYRHYAPNIPVLLFSSKDFQPHAYDWSKTLVLTNDALITELPHVWPLNSQTLFENFRKAEQATFEQIVVVYSLEDAQDLGLMNRLHKASQ